MVGSFDIPESVLLAHIYADALAAKGFPTEVLPNLGNRELVEPALMNGLIQLVPDYAGSALHFLSLGQLRATSDAAATHASLARSAEGRGLVAAQPASAQNANEIVVTAATVARHHLRSSDDLAGVAPDLVFGGPTECPQREYCLKGLERSYGLHFKAFTPTDAGGPMTRHALVSGQIDVGLLFTTDPGIAAQHLVVLADNRGLQPSENVTPLVSKETVTRYGQPLLDTLDAVSANLSTSTLRHLNSLQQEVGQDPRTIAADWLQAQALAPGRRAAR